MLDGFFNFMFGWAISLGSPWSILIMSLILTSLITLIYKFTTDQILLKELKNQVKHYQKLMKEHKTDPSKMMESQKQAMGLNMKLMKHSMKPMLYTFVPIILIFSWLKNISDIGAKDIIDWGFHIPLFGTGLGWLGTYIISSIIFSMILRKLLKVY